MDRYLGSHRWNTCAPFDHAAVGWYILKVTNSGKGGSAPIPTTAPTSGACRQHRRPVTASATVGRAMCPGCTERTPSPSSRRHHQMASPYLAEIEPSTRQAEARSSTPAKAGNTIMRATDGNTWTRRLQLEGGHDGHRGTNVNSSTPRIPRPLQRVGRDHHRPGYSPPTNNDWWQIRHVRGRRTGPRGRPSAIRCTVED
jgi:hypothetical protein